VMRILVPLAITDEQLNDGLQVMEAALAAVSDRAPALSHA
jgi:4-aminobutyrate aminotransferase-like enzyme